MVNEMSAFNLPPGVTLRDIDPPNCVCEFCDKEFYVNEDDDEPICPQCGMVQPAIDYD